MSKITLYDLTGLSDHEVAEALAENPRAYMAVRGAVAEKHLEKYLNQLLSAGQISEFRTASSDFDKDFVIVTLSGDEYILECKNVQVLTPSTKRLKAKYIAYLLSQQEIGIDEFVRYLSESTTLREAYNLPENKLVAQIEELLSQEKTSVLENFIRQLPQALRESGHTRYEFSKSFLFNTLAVEGQEDSFIQQFYDPKPMSIDFQKTRNTKGEKQEARFYQTDEIDIVAACLFPRTLEWQFLFGRAKYFEMHKVHTDRYSNKLVIQSPYWKLNLLEVLENE